MVAYSRIGQHFEQLRGWAANMAEVSRVALEFMESDTYRDWLINGIDPGGTVNWAATGIVRAFLERQFCNGLRSLSGPDDRSGPISALARDALTGAARSALGAFCDLQSVVNLDSEIPGGVLQGSRGPERGHGPERVSLSSSVRRVCPHGGNRETVRGQPAIPTSGEVLECET